MVQADPATVENRVWRLHFVVVCMTLLFGLLIWRVLVLHTVEKDFLQGQGDARTVRTDRIAAHRGMIQDRRGKPLAISSPVGSIWMNPQKVAEHDDRLDELARGLEIDQSVIRRRIDANPTREFIYLKRHLAPLDAERIMALNIAGIHEQREYHRYYPAGEVAAQILGFTNIDDAGQEGVELAFDDWLKGQPGKKKVLKNLYGQVVRDIKPLVDAQPGRSLSLSLDLRVQYLAYRELKTAVKLHNAQSGSVVILDVETGEVLAMVNQPSFNPNDRSTLKASSARNRAVTDLFEPGSTVKPFTVAAAFQSGRFESGTLIDTAPGFHRVGDLVVRDPSNSGVLDVAAIVAKSSQVGITRIALNLDVQDIWEMFRGVGFGQETGAGFPGESAGYLPNHNRWTDVDKVTFSYGYGLSVTPLQLAGAYLVLATGGIRQQISMVKGAPSASQRVMEKEVASELLRILQQVVTDGTGSLADVAAYSVAGKTGTVRKVGPSGYEREHHLAFFAGIAPVTRPRLVAVVLINDPQSEAQGGGAIAAPVFSRVMAGALRLLNIPPDRIGEAA